MLGLRAAGSDGGTAVITQAQAFALAAAAPTPAATPTPTPAPTPTPSSPVGAGVERRVPGAVLGLRCSADGTAELVWAVPEPGWFGALSAFMMLHLAVLWYYLKRKGSKSYLTHLVFPLIGFLIIAYVLINAGVQAQLAGLVWLLIGAAIWGYNRATGKTITISGDMSGLAEERI